MRTIGIVNQKGGVAKTTTARETAAMLAAGGHPTVAVDLDGQHDLTDFFLDGAEPPATVSDVLGGRATVSDALTATGRDGLDIVPADDGAHSLARTGVGADRVRAMLDGLAEGHEYAVIDFPRLVSATTVAALAACDAVVVPTEASRASAEAAAATVDAVSRLGGPPVSLLITRHNPRTTIGRQYADLIAETASEQGARLHSARIPLAAAAQEAEGYGLTLGEHRPRSKPARAYGDYLAELMGWMGWS